jgi:prepilin-type N-terminal cleavage/methylation domain-containing protein
MKSKHRKHSAAARKSENGFTLVEVIIAMVIFLVVILGVFAAFTYAVAFNSGNSKRSQALSVLQREVEQMRSAKFTPTSTDPTLTGGVKAERTVTSSDNFVYRINVTVDDDPFTDGVQTNAAKTIKEVTIVVTPQAVNGAWETAFQSRSVLIRSRGN